MTERMSIDEFKRAATVDVRSVKARGRTRHEPGKMNTLEKEYAAELALRVLAGDIAWWAFEPIRLKLANNTTYTPDFAILHFDGLVELVEIKGHWEDDARVKIKVAAHTYFMFQFTAITVAKGERKVETFE